MALTQTFGRVTTKGNTGGSTGVLAGSGGGSNATAMGGVSLTLGSRTLGATIAAKPRRRGPVDCCCSIRQCPNCPRRNAQN